MSAGEEKLKFSMILGEGTYNNNAKKIVRDNNNNLYVLTTELDKYSSAVQSSDGYMVVTKYDVNGNELLKINNIATSVNTGFDAPVGCDMTVDVLGNIYIVGYILSKASLQGIFEIALTPSNILPVTANAFQKEAHALVDAFIMKYDKNGSLIYASYLGGQKVTSYSILGDPAPMTFGLAIAVDSNENAWITGTTTRRYYAATKEAVQAKFKGGVFDSYVAKFNRDGTQISYFTYLGGNRDDFGLAIALDKDENIIIAGETDAVIVEQLLNTNIYGKEGNFYKKNAYQDKFAKGATASGFITKLNNNGAGIFSTYFGGNIGENIITSVAVNSNKDIFVAGMTGGEFPITANSYLTQADNKKNYYIGFISKFNESGNLVASSYIGGNNDFNGQNGLVTQKYFIVPGTNLNDNKSYDGVVRGLALDNTENIYVTGETESIDFPVTDDAFQIELNYKKDSFTCILNSDLSKLIYSTYLGGKDNDTGNSIVGDTMGNIYVVGQTSSEDFYATLGCSGALKDGSGFLLKFVDGACIVLGCCNRDSKYIYRTGPVYKADKESRINIVLENQNEADANINIKIMNLSTNKISKEIEVNVLAGYSRIVGLELKDRFYEIILSNVPCGVYIFSEAIGKQCDYSLKFSTNNKINRFYHKDFIKVEQ